MTPKQQLADFKLAVKELLAAHDDLTKMSERQTWTNNYVHPPKERIIAWQKFHAARDVVEQMLKE